MSVARKLPISLLNCPSSMPAFGLRDPGPAESASCFVFRNGFLKHLDLQKLKSRFHQEFKMIKKARSSRQGTRECERMSLYCSLSNLGNLNYTYFREHLREITSTLRKCSIKLFDSTDTNCTCGPRRNEKARTALR